MKQSFRTKLKQLWVPKVFRLPEPEFTKDQVDLLEDLIQLIHPTLSMAETASRDDRVQMAHFLVDLGTGIWRIRRKIESLGRMPKEIRDALYSLESTWMSMSEGGVEIVDHIGTIPSRNEAKIVEVRDIPNLAREQVVDAIKPTILLKGEVIQLGEVVMGRPAKNDAPQEMPAEPAEPVEPRSAFTHPEEEEETVSHEVETLSMELPAKPISEMSDFTDDEIGTPAEETEPAEPDEAPLPEEAQEIEVELPVSDEDDPIAAMPDEVTDEPFVPDGTVESEPELTEQVDVIELETPVTFDPAFEESDLLASLDDALEAMELSATDETDEPTDDVAEEKSEEVSDAPLEAPEVEEGFVRDVPTPFEQAIVQEEAEEPKKKRTKKAKAEKADKANKENKESGEAPKPKKRKGTKKSAAVAEAENDG